MQRKVRIYECLFVWHAVVWTLSVLLQATELQLITTKKWAKWAVDLWPVMLPTVAFAWTRWLSNYAAPVSFSVYYSLLLLKKPSFTTDCLLFLEIPWLEYSSVKPISSIICTISVFNSPQVSSLPCPGLSVEIPHRYQPCFSKRLSSGTFLGADTKPTIGVKKNLQLH